MMFTPNGPNAGPSGGPADASPPVTNDEMFCVLAIIFLVFEYDLFLTMLMKV